MAVRPYNGAPRDGDVGGDSYSWRATALLLLACVVLGAGLAASSPATAGRLLGLAAFASVIALLGRAWLSERGAHLRSRRAYQESVEQRRKFISTVSHDFRSPLTAVVGFTQLLSDQLDTLEPERRRTYLRMIREQSQHLSRMIEDTVDLSRLAEGRLTINPATRRLEAVVGGALALLDHAVDQERITTAIEADTPPLWVDQYELEQVLDRLFHYALTHSAKGTHLTLHAAPAPGGNVEISLRADGLNTAGDSLRPLAGDLTSAITLGQEDQRYLAMATVRALVALHRGSIRTDDGAFTLLLPTSQAGSATE